MTIGRSRTLARGLTCIMIGMLAAGPAFGQQRFRLSGDAWQEQSNFDPSSPEGQLQAIRKQIAAGDAKDAQDAAEQWIERYDGHPMMDEAYLLRGDARAARQHYFKALFDYEIVIRQYPASDHFVTALEREFEIARLFANGMKRKWLGTRMLSAVGEAEEIFIRIQERLPGSELGEQAMLELGDLYFRQAEMTSAVDAYDLFLLNYPRSSYRERAMLRLIEASLATFKGPRFDPTGLIEASQRIKQFERDFPASAERLGADALLVRINELLALKQQRVAEWYVARGDEVAAAYMYQRVVRDYPQTSAARLSAQALRDMGKAVVVSPDVYDASDIVDPPAEPEQDDEEAEPAEEQS